MSLDGPEKRRVEYIILKTTKKVQKSLDMSLSDVE